MSSPTPLFCLQSKADTFYFLYFLLHIPITILIDSSLVLSKEYRLPIQNQLIDFHIASNKDFLLENPPTWLVFFGWIEILVQLPFFFVGAYYLFKRNQKIEFYLTLYGLEASLTTLSCLCFIFVFGKSNGLIHSEITNLVLVYLPTFIIPFYMLVEVCGRFDERFFESQKREQDEKDAKKTK